MQTLKKEIPNKNNDIDHKTILIIEDDESIGALITEVLSQETHYNVLLATDGFQALHIVNRVKPNLLITDYRLPRMDGIELYDRLHSLQSFNDTPVIIMSAHLPVEEVSKRQLVSMDKPFDLDDFLAKVEGALCA